MPKIERALTGPGLRARGVALVVVCLAAGAVSGLMILRSTATGDATFLMSIVGGPVFTIVGSVIVLRRPGHRIGRLMVANGFVLTAIGAVGLVLGLLTPPGLRPGPVNEVAEGVSDVVNTITILVGSVLLIVWFPDGARTSTVGTIVEALLGVLVLGLLGSHLWPSVVHVLDGLLFPMIIACYGLAFVDLLQRYRRADAMRRAQIRWVMAAAGITAILVVVLLVFGESFEWLWSLWIVSTLLPAVAVGIAITRYHLYDIDRIVSNAVGYGLVSLILLSVFWGINLGLQHVLSQTFAAGPFVVAGSTLLVAALFDPVRTRTQTVVDRRFHRAHYDAERLVASFAGRLRDELDLDHLADELARTTAKAVEPSSATVWLRTDVAR